MSRNDYSSSAQSSWKSFVLKTSGAMTEFPLHESIPGRHADKMVRKFNMTRRELFRTLDCDNFALPRRNLLENHHSNKVSFLNAGHLVKKHYVFNPICGSCCIHCFHWSYHLSVQWYSGRASCRASIHARACKMGQVHLHQTMLRKLVPCPLECQPECPCGFSSTHVCMHAGIMHHQLDDTSEVDDVLELSIWLGAQDLYTNTARGRPPQTPGSLFGVYVFSFSVPSFPLENKLFGIHQTCFCLLRHLSFQSWKHLWCIFSLRYDCTFSKP